MPPDIAPKPTLAPELSKGRLEQAFELITEEAIQVLTVGRDPRAFQKTEKLLAIARAVRLECGTRVADVEEGQKRRRPEGIVLDAPGFLIGEEEGDINMDQLYAPPPMQMAYGNGRETAAGDFRREHQVAQLEGLAARRRRDDADARLTMIREFKELQEIDLGALPDENREGIKIRLTEIANQLCPPRTNPTQPDTETT